MDDSISRLATVDAVYKRIKQIGYEDNPLVLSIRQTIRDLPSAQPEIIRCKYCKYWHREIYNGIEYFNFSSCDLNHHGDGRNFYCADAERKEE